MGLSRKESWTELPSPPPGDLPDPEIKPAPSALQGDSLPLSNLVEASLMAQMIKCLPAVQETWVRSLGWEDPLEKEMATHSSTLAWKIP